MPRIQKWFETYTFKVLVLYVHWRSRGSPNSKIRTFWNGGNYPIILISDYPYIKKQLPTTFHWLAADGRCYKVGSSESQKPFEAPCQWCQWQSHPDQNLGTLVASQGSRWSHFFETHAMDVSKHSADVTTIHQQEIRENMVVKKT